MSTRLSCLIALASAALVTHLADAQGVQYPPDANVANVLAFGAIPNDNNPDTAAFQAALNATVGSNRILYIPNGIYNFDDRLDWGSINTGKALQLQGQSRAGVILRLNPTSPGFQNNWDSSDPDSIANEQKPFIDVYEGNTANAFENYLNDVTIEVGPGNPGAIGLQFQSNNTGAIRNVTIRSTDPNRLGAKGLDLVFAFPGPFLAKDLTIEGFDEGIGGAPQEYSVTFENLTLRNQRVRGIGVWRLPIQIRNLVSVNTVPVVQSFNNPGAWGHIVIDGASLTGGSPTNDAIINEDGSGVLLLRNVTTQGYRFAVNDLEGSAPITLPDGFVAQHTTDPPQSLNPSPTAMLPLFAEETPAVPEFPIAQWASVKAFGAIENDNLDDTDAIIAAMNSGAPVVYFPTGQYRVSRTIEIPPTLHRLEGLNSNFAVNAPLAMENGALFRVGPGAQPIVFISGCNASFNVPGPFNGVWVEHATANTLVLRDGACEGYRNTVAGGRVFIENIVGSRFVFTGQRVFARQFNPEGSVSPHIINDGGDFYVLGLKTEGSPTVLDTRNRGRSLVLGGLIYASTNVPDRTRPIYAISDSSVSVSSPESAYVDPLNAYGLWIRETRNSVTSTLASSGFSPLRGRGDWGAQLALFNAYAPDASAPSVPGVPAIAGTTLGSIALTWTPAADAQSGIARYDIIRNGVFRASSTTPSFTDTDLPDGASFTYRVLAINGAGLASAQSGLRTAAALADTQAPRVTAATAGLDPRAVRVAFSEPVSASAANPANYSITGPAPVTVTAAALADDRRSVTLTTTPMSAGTHGLSITGVTDRASTPNPIASGNLTAFAFSATSAGTGLTANYFLNRDFIGSPVLTRVEGPIDFPYGLNSPAPGIPADNFAVRWSGQLRPRFNETYTLFVLSDDGTRLFIDGRLIISNWADQGPTERSATIALDSSRTYDIVVEYYENSGGAIAQLSWQSPSQSKQIIPASALFPASRLTTVRTTQGVGADTTIERLGANDNGNSNAMGAFHSPAAGGFHDAVYFRFDLSSLNLANNTPAEAFVTLSQTFFGVGSGIRDINFFNVRQSANGDNWTETGPGFVTWNTAAGLDQSGGLANPATARFVSTFRLDNTGFLNNNQPDKAFFTGQRLIDALTEDTDNRLTFIGKRVDASNEGQSWFTKEWGLPTFAPALKVRLIPNCPQITTQPIVPAGILSGRSVVLFAAAQGKPPLTYQWLRNGEPIADGPGPLGGTYAGADSPALTIEGFTCEPGALYQLRVTNACGAVISAPAALSPCIADLDCSGDIDLADFFGFLNCFDVNEPCADINGDNTIDLADFFEFLNVFDTGC